MLAGVLARDAGPPDLPPVASIALAPAFLSCGKCGDPSTHHYGFWAGIAFRRSCTTCQLTGGPCA